MAIDVLTSNDLQTIAELIDFLGNVPPERIPWFANQGHATEGDLLRFANASHKRLCELIDGFLVEKAIGSWESLIATSIIVHLGNYVKQRKLGKLFAPDGMFRLSPGLVRAPDIAFVSSQRLQGLKPFVDNILPVAPDLAIEVLSKSNTEREMQLKLRQYFDSGVRLCWLIDPRQRSVDVYHGPEDFLHLGGDEVLSGEDVIAGYSIRLTDLFSDLDE